MFKDAKDMLTLKKVDSDDELLQRVIHSWSQTNFDLRMNLSIEHRLEDYF